MNPGYPRTECAAAPRKVIVIGAGATGLAVADNLSASGCDITVIEQSHSVGGLASPWAIPTPTGPVEWDRFYHVVLSGDTSVLSLLERLGLGVEYRTIASELLAGGQVHPFSSPVDLLRAPGLTPVDRARVAGTIVAGGLLPTGSAAIRRTSASWLEQWSGRRAFTELWNPMLRAKLGTYSDQASSVFIRSTFQRLIRARLSRGDGDRFGFVPGGYRVILDRWVHDLEDRGVDLRLGSPVEGLCKVGDGWRVITPQDVVDADEVVITTAAPAAARLLREVDADLPMTRQLESIDYLGVVCVSVLLRRPLTGGYLTYITDETPYTAIVEMTRLVGEDQLGGLSLVYLPKYAAVDDPLFDTDPEIVAQRFVDDLMSRYPSADIADVVAARTASARAVMPIPVVGRVPGRLQYWSGLPGLYVASNAHVDDGTLNVESSLQVAAAATAQMDKDRNRHGR